MAEITLKEKIAKQTLYEIGYEYLRDNFHKLSDHTKVRVSIEMLKIFNKDDSKTKNDMQQIVIMNDIQKNGIPLRYNLGQSFIPSDVEDPGQARPDTSPS